MKKVFLDSGAHSLYELVVREDKKAGKRLGYKYYESDEFWKYVDDYAAFVKKYIDRIEVYVNVDAIFNPELSWKVQRYLVDAHKLNPLPVVHYAADMKWLKLYMDNCDYIGIGGLGQEVNKKQYYIFADNVFRMICNSKGTPKWKTHGFAITSINLLFRYPWYSVDSATYRIEAGFGAIFIPKRRKGKWNYFIQPTRVCLSALAKDPQYTHFIHQFDHLKKEEKTTVLRYIDEMTNYPLGKSEFENVDKDYELKENERWFKKKSSIIERIIEPGLTNSGEMRSEHNLRFFMEVEKAFNKLGTLGKRFDIVSQPLFKEDL